MTENDTKAGAEPLLIVDDPAGRFDPPVITADTGHGPTVGGINTVGGEDYVPVAIPPKIPRITVVDEGLQAGSVLEALAILDDQARQRAELRQVLNGRDPLNRADRRQLKRQRRRG